LRKRVIVLLVLAGLSALLAFLSLPKTLPDPPLSFFPQCSPSLLGNQSLSCYHLMLSIYPHSQNPAYLLSRLFGLLAAISTVAALLALAVRFRIDTAGIRNRALIFVMSLGLVLFWFMVAVNCYGSYYFGYPDVIREPVVAQAINVLNFLTLGLIANDPLGKGGFLGFAIAFVAFLLLKKDVWQGIGFFAAPLLIAFEACIFFLWPDQMSIYATGFATWSVDGVFVFSNGIVLIASLIIFGTSLIALEGKKHAPEMQAPSSAMSMPSERP